MRTSLQQQVGLSKQKMAAVFPSRSFAAPTIWYNSIFWGCLVNKHFLKLVSLFSPGGRSRPSQGRRRPSENRFSVQRGPGDQGGRLRNRRWVRCRFSRSGWNSVVGGASASRGAAASPNDPRRRLLTDGVLEKLLSGSAYESYRFLSSLLVMMGLLKVYTPDPVSPKSMKTELMGTEIVCCCCCCCF